MEVLEVQQGAIRAQIPAASGVQLSNRSHVLRAKSALFCYGRLIVRCVLTVPGWLGQMM